MSNRTGLSNTSRQIAGSVAAGPLYTLRWWLTARH